jgi:HK97 family phage prohead protease
MRTALNRSAKPKADGALGEALSRRWSVSSVKPENRTFTVVFTTGAAVSRRDPWTGEVYREELVVSDQAIDMARLNSGAPFLDNHRLYGSVAEQLGVVERAWIENGKGMALIRFPQEGVDPAADEIFAKIDDGILRSVSVGYTRNEIEVDKSKTPEIWSVTRWTPHEISIVTVPADNDAKIRSKTMKNSRKRGAPQRQNTEIDVLDRDDIIEGRDIDQDDRDRASETRAERRRVRELRDIAEQGGIETEELNLAIEDGVEPGEFRQRAFEIMAARERRTMTRPARDTMVHDRAPENARFITDALAHRMAPDLIQPGDANPYAGMRIPDMARQYLSDGGASVRGLTDSEIIGRVLSGGGGDFGTRAAHGSSDFPLLLQSAGERSLLARFAALPSPLKTLSNERNARDFRTQSMIRPGEAPRLEKLSEHGEITHGTMSEESDAYQVDTYAKIFGLSRKALVNDDLGAFSDFMSAFAVSANATEGDLFYALLSANAFAGKTLGDGTALFHADRGNLAASGAVLSINALSAARAAMRQQKDVNGTGKAGLVPKYLLVGPAQETLAEQLIATINAATVSNVNPFSGKLSLLVEDRYEGSGWWLFADPANEPAFVHAYLEGRNGPQVEMREGWEVLGMEMRCILDFGCGVREYRAAYRNPGA